MKSLISIKSNSEKQAIIKHMPKKYSQFSARLSDIWQDGKLIEIQIGDKVYHGKCFINTEKRQMPWYPAYQWYVFLEELDVAYSFDILKDKLCRIIPTDIQLNTFFENKLKTIIKKGKYHLRETQKAYIDLQELKHNSVQGVTK